MKKKSSFINNHLEADIPIHPKLSAIIKKHEGLRLKPYTDSVGKLTIGYGHNLSDNGITLEIATAILKADIDIAMTDARSVLKDTYWTLSQDRQWVIINMIFNLGKTRFATFKKLIAALKGTNYTKAAEEMLNSKWAKQVGPRAIELAEIMRNG